MVKGMTTATSEQLLPLLKAYEEQYVSKPKTDSLISDIASGAVYMAIERMIAAIAKDVTDGLAWKAEAAAAMMIQESNAQSTNQLQKTIQQSYGLDISNLLRAQNIQPTLQLAQTVNVNLIKSIPSQYFEKLNHITLQAVQQGQRYEDVADSIQTLYGVTDSRAKLIARDQTAKTNAAIARTRHQDLGISKYRWITAGDERVRPTHADNEGQVFSYDDPPAETGNPGDDVNCRCIAAPIIGDYDSGEGDEDGG